MPIGSQNLFLISFSVSHGIPRAYLLASAVVVFDVLLGVLCFWAGGELLSALGTLRPFLQAAAILYMAALGACLVRSALLDPTRETNQPRTKGGAGVVGAVRSLLALTWLNPQAWADGVAVLGGARATMSGSDAVGFLGGMVFASIIWFFGVTTVVGALRTRLPSGASRAITGLGGAGLVASAAVMALQVF
jgi:L-lysine exporter family protein LysE/ArgO